MKTKTKNAVNRYLDLQERGFQPSLEEGLHSLIRVKENLSSYTIENAGAYVTAHFHVDGGIINSNEVGKCDYLVLLRKEPEKNKWVEIFVELKGIDYVHSLEQIVATIENSIFRKMQGGVRFARVSYRHSTLSSGLQHKARQLRSKIENQLKCQFEENSSRSMSESADSIWRKSGI